MLFAAALLLLQTAPAAQTTACKATDASLPTALLGWVKPGDEFVPGKAVELDTIDGAALKGLPVGSKPGKAAMIGFKVEICCRAPRAARRSLRSSTAMARSARRSARSSASISSRACTGSTSRPSRRPR
jgi:hypothetical protein